MSSRGTLSLVTAPAAEPIGLADTKPYLRVDSNADDGVLMSLITAVRRHFDGEDAWFGRALLTQTWELILDHFPYSSSGDSSRYYSRPEICVPLPPLQSVTSIYYYDQAGVLTLLPSTEYVVDSKSEPGRISPAYGKSWPSTRDVPNAVTVRFVAGYGNAAAVPEDIKTWLRQAVAYFYRQREATELPSSFFWSLARYRVAWGS